MAAGHDDDENYFTEFIGISSTLSVCVPGRAGYKIDVAKMCIPAHDKEEKKTCLSLFIFTHVLTYFADLHFPPSGS
jgi:hypothetical protein